VWEHVMFDSVDTLLNNQPYTSVNDGVWKGSQFTSLVGYGDNLSADLLKPTDSSWTTSQGVGLIYHYDGGSANANRVMLRGGRFSSTSGTGVCATYLFYNTGSGSYSVGFRCAR
jgi:hypothetical protein